MKTFKQFTKITNFTENDGAVNAAGGGNIAGIGIGPDGEPGGRKALLRKLLRRTSPMTKKALTNEGTLPQDSPAAKAGFTLPPKKDDASMLKNIARAATSAITQSGKDQKVYTPNATIGVRG